MSIRKIRSLVIVFFTLAAIAGATAIPASRASESGIGTGVVVINTDLRLDDSWAAGTGMVLTSSGRILTNNHVIAGATTIRVALPDTTRRYAARVVGYDMADDVAILQLRGAANLATVTIGSSAAVRIGQGVTAVGNSGGAGRLITVRGRVVRLRRSITVEDETGKLRWLAGLIQTDAALRPGDSGGPLLDGAGRVVGMNTAASYRYGYAVPGATAMRVTQQIVAGKASARVHIGATAFFGVRVQGTTVAEVLPGSPAAAAGLKPGYVIISVAGRRVTGEAGITAAVLAHKPGELVTIVYRDDAGMRRSVRVRLKAGPPQ